jgi:hypothetical protein
MGESLGRGAKAQSVNDLPIWSPQVGGNDERGAILKERLDGWDRRPDARVVNDLAVGERHIEVNA